VLFSWSARQGLSSVGRKVTTRRAVIGISSRSWGSTGRWACRAAGSCRSLKAYAFAFSSASRNLLEERFTYPWLRACLTDFSNSMSASCFRECHFRSQARNWPESRSQQSMTRQRRSASSSSESSYLDTTRKARLLALFIPLDGHVEHRMSAPAGAGRFHGVDERLCRLRSATSTAGPESPANRRNPGRGIPPARGSASTSNSTAARAVVLLQPAGCSSPIQPAVSHRWSTRAHRPGQAGCVAASNAARRGKAAFPDRLDVEKSTRAWPRPMLLQRRSVGERGDPDVARRRQRKSRRGRRNRAGTRGDLETRTRFELAIDVVADIGEQPANEGASHHARWRQGIGHPMGPRWRRNPFPAGVDEAKFTTSCSPPSASSGAANEGSRDSDATSYRGRHRRATGMRSKP